MCSNKYLAHILILLIMWLWLYLPPLACLLSFSTGGSELKTEFPLAHVHYFPFTSWSSFRSAIKHPLKASSNIRSNLTHSGDHRRCKQTEKIAERVRAKKSKQPYTASHCFDTRFQGPQSGGAERESLVKRLSLILSLLEF